MVFAAVTDDVLPEEAVVDEPDGDAVADLPGDAECAGDAVAELRGVAVCAVPVLPGVAEPVPVALPDGVARAVPDPDRPLMVRSAP